MGTVRYRQMKWINGIYIVCLLGCISLAVEEFQHEFDIQLYEKNISWIHCPEGWTKIGIECIKVETEALSYDEAEKVCGSYGGHLVKIKGFNLNKVIGETAKEVLLAKAVGTTRAWIGFYQNIDGNYMWSDGHVGEEMEGFWAEGQSMQFVSGIRQCGTIETNGSLYGPNRWHLEKCEQKLPFVCQTIPCVEGQFRCADGQKCIIQTSKCDGQSDCQDGSDEMNCTKAQCMSVLYTPNSTFQSPNFPGKYPSYADCKWKVIAPIGSKVQLNFTFFQTEERYDVVKFYDGLSTSDDLIGNFSGSLRPDTVVSSTNFLLVIFSSDQDIEMSGFSAQWTSVMPETCGGNLTATRKLQWFTSPNYPRNYPNNIICDWIITAPEQDRVVTIQIEDFLVDEPLDWLEVHDRGFEEDDLILLLSGKQTVYRNIVSSGRQIFIRFRTSLKDSSQGFNITYQSGCGSLIVKGYGELYSPGYRASSYPNGINCTWTIEDPQGRALTLVFHNFSTEVNFDTVKVFNDSSYSPQAASGPFSGVKNEIIIHSSTGHFLIHFVSDGQVSRSGWSASFSYDCTSVFPIPQNAQVSQNSSWYGAKINYSCDIGFVINGPIPRVCDIGGVWRTPPPSCSAVFCGSPGTVKYGSLVRVNNNSYGGVAEYKCNKGFEIDGNYSIVCGTEGWTPLPQCIAVRCPKLKVPSQGRLISPNMYIFGARVEFRCIEGYRLIGASYLLCLMNGQWSDNETSCEPNVTCQELIILHGMVNSSGPVMYRTVIEVKCLPGYKIKGDSNILTCNEAGDYDRDVPTCEDIDECSENNRTCGFGNHCINTIGSYWCLCENGYQWVPENTSQCTDVNECQINNGGCEHICKNNNGSYSCNCQSGYHLYEAENITIFDGRALIPGKSCLVSCPAVKIKNGSIFANSSQAADQSFYYPTVVRILCDRGWVPDGEYTIHCQANGTWSANVTQCRVGTCEQLPNISNGKISYNDSLNFGSLATYDCDPDYRLEGSRWRLCYSGLDSEGMPKYQWTGSEPVCKSVNWYPPPALDNGRVVYGTIEYGSVANYSCQCGYKLRGSTTRTYLKYGLWSNEEIVCIAKTCPRVDAPLNGNIVNQQSIYPVGSLVQYQCNAGFELQGCLHQVIDENGTNCRSDVAATIDFNNILRKLCQFYIQYSYHNDYSRPLLCNLDPGSDEGDLPYLHMLISLRLKPSPSNVIISCMAPYAEKIIANLKPNISQLSVHCEAIVKVLVDLQENYTIEKDNGNRIKVVLKLQLTLLEHVTQASKGCECANKILLWINTNIDTYIAYLNIAGIDNCPTLELNPKSVELVGKDWKCPANQTMNFSANDQCVGQIPVCKQNAQDCKPSLPRLTNIYTSASTSVVTSVQSVTASAITFPTTTDAGITNGSSLTSTYESNSTVTTSDDKTGSASDHTPTVSLTLASSSSTSSMTLAAASTMSTIRDVTNTTTRMTTTVTTLLGTETTETKSSTGATATSLSSKSTMMTTTTGDDNETSTETSSTTTLMDSSATAVSTTPSPTTLMTAGISTTTFTVTQGSSTIKRTTIPITSTVYVTSTPTISSTTTKTSICPALESFQSSTTSSALTSTVVPGHVGALLSQSVTSQGQIGNIGSETPVFVLQTDAFMSITPNHSVDCEQQLNNLISGIVQSIMNCLIENRNQSCQYGYNLHYMDTHGNITIKNDQMNISVPFKVLDNDPSIHSVENCKEVIQVILNHTAVTLLATIPALMNANCSIRIVFNPNHFQVTYAKWTCGAGYQFDNKTRLCQTCTDCPTETSPTTVSSLPITSSSSLPGSTDSYSTNSTSLVSSVKLTSFSSSKTDTLQPESTVTSTAVRSVPSSTGLPSTISVLTTKSQTELLPSTVSATTQNSSSVTTAITTQPTLSTTRETSKLSSGATSTQLSSPTTAATTSSPSPTSTSNTQASTTAINIATQSKSTTLISTQVTTTIKSTDPPSTAATTTQPSSTTSKTTQVPTTTTQPSQPSSLTSLSSQVPTTTQSTQPSSTTSKSSQVPSTTQSTQPSSSTSISSQVPTTTQSTQPSSTSISSQVPSTTQPTQPSSSSSLSSQVPTTTQPTQPSSSTSISSQVPTTTQPTQPSSLTSISSQVPTTTQPTQPSSTTSKSSQVPSTTQPTQPSSSTSISSQVPSTTQPTQPSSSTSISSQVPSTTQSTQPSSSTSISSQVPTTTQPTQPSSSTSISSQVPTTTQPTQPSSSTSISSQVPSTTQPTQPSSSTSLSSQAPTTTQSTQPSSTTSISSQVPSSTQPTQPSSSTSISSQVPTTTQPTQSSLTTSKSSQVPSTTQPTQPSSAVMTSINTTATASTGTTSSPVPSIVTSSTQILTTASTTLTTRSTSVCSIEKNSANTSLSIPESPEHIPLREIAFHSIVISEGLVASCKSEYETSLKAVLYSRQQDAVNLEPNINRGCVNNSIFISLVSSVRSVTMSGNQVIINFSIRLVPSSDIDINDKYSACVGIVLQCALQNGNIFGLTEVNTTDATCQALDLTSTTHAFDSLSDICIKGTYNNVTRRCEEAVTTTTQQPFSCYSCKSVSNDTNCTTYTTCSGSQNTCQTEVRYNRSQRTVSITKTCADNQTCNANRENKNCVSTNLSPVCYYCCYSSLCNNQTIINESIFKVKSIQMMNAVSTQVSGLSDSAQPKGRKKRDLQAASPAWNSSVPVCRDITPPKFMNCPSNILIEVGRSGPFPVDVKLPNVTDNSGGAVFMNVIYPINFTSPYLFKQNTTMKIEAYDIDRNMATCNISIIIKDLVPPELICPTEVVYIKMDTTDRMVNLDYNQSSLAINSSDAVHLEYSPQPSERIPLLESILVTIKAYDQSSNEAVCNFYLFGLPTGCPDWSLSSPRHGTKSCNHSMGSSVICVMTCDNGYRFVDSATNYTCTENGTWIPHNLVPDCVGGQHPNQEVFTAWNFSVPYSDSNIDCSINLTFENELLELFKENCTEAVRVTALNTNIHIRHTDSGKEVDIESRVRFSSTQRLSSFPCVTRRFLTPTLPPVVLLTPCGNLTLVSISNISSQEVCPEGFVKLSEIENSTFYCYPCTEGMYAVADQCKPCPPGFYQDLGHQTDCKPCPNGTSTVSSYTKNITGCLKYCGSGFFSETGLVPCNLCPHGTFQEIPGSKSCVPCPGNTTTRTPGAASQKHCSEPCRQGSYSSTGLEPCTPCPRHFYSETPGAMTCKECPPGLATQLEGTESVGDCKEIHFCGNNSCRNKASCIEFDRYYTCQCQPGFTGLYCEININECASNPCVNGGTCQDDVNSFRCICSLGYTGSYCERDVDECASNPCKYGICQDGSNMFTCVCYDGFEGYLCDINKDDCVNNQCQNRGQCVDLVGGYMCNCTGTGFSAPHCVNMSSLCDGKLCANGGTCMEANNSIKCLCPEGFYGQFCHMVDDLCASSPCQHGGLCLQSGMRISCECKAGFTGTMCELDLDDCAKKPCLNGATCRDLPNGFSCSCTKGFTGLLCEEDIYNNCANYSCNQTNTLQCQDTGPGFTCTCRPGWKGALCDVEINECQSNPCVHGTCKDYLNGYTCTCAGGYAGPNCNEDIDECMSSPCLNRGRCLNGQNNFSCSCQAGFTGNMCEMDINECENSPCQNGGSCIDIVNEYYCSCTTLWTGSQCEIQNDDCTSLPCAQGATCNVNETGFFCHCPKGYTGAICDTEIKECLSNPCLNNGTCVDQLNNYTCYCDTGYYGNNCQHMVDYCSKSNPCENGGSCRSTINGYICQCSVNFTGYNCEKVKSGSFDLQFFNDSQATSKPPARELKEVSQLSICLWVRFDEQGGNGIFLTVSSVSSNGTGQSMQLVIFHSSGIILTLFPNVPSYNITLSQLNNGMWHHLCLTWSNSDTGTVQVFLDASNGSVIHTGYGGNQTLHGWHQVEVGQVQLKNEILLFKGKVSQVNIYSSLLQPETIAAMATSCHGDSYYGNLWSWKEFDIYLPDHRFIIHPSSCGELGCPSGFCSIPIVDKSPPIVVSCPKDIEVVSLDRLNLVTWNQPVFSDDVGVARVEQTAHSSGTFSYGQYDIVYTAFDHDGNSAICSFRVYVTPKHCEMPSGPLNGVKDCGDWSQGQYCRIKCLGNNDFTEPTALLYNCGKEGFWDPPRGRVFRFPPCSAVSDPSISLYGSLTLLGPNNCTIDRKTNVTRSVYQVLAQLSLGTECACNLSGINVDCSSNLQSGRRKRETGSSEYKVSFTFTFSSGEIDGAINQIQSYVKEGRFDTQEFTLDSNQTIFKTQLSCKPDQVLNFNNKCVNCQPGTYQNNTSGSCELCPFGYYTAIEKQLNCSKCPENQTTESLGATSEIDCYSICSVGYFWDRVTRLCELCEAGQYQDVIGQTSCKPCPNGKTTPTEGSTSIQQCIYHCSQGNEINALGRCQPCPKGTYKDKMDVEQCQSCPSGFTTKSDGTISLESCSLVLCPAGKYRSDNNTCLPCLQGSYQPQADQTRCLLCGKGLTTPSSGAITKETCINGSVDECSLEIDNCDTEAECTDSEDSYKCECKLGFTGNGTYCKDNCADYCGQNGQCNKNSSGFPFCTCTKDYDGLNCETYIGTKEDLTTGQIAGIVTGLAVGLGIILVVWLSFYCMKKRKCKAVLVDKLGVPRLHRSEMTSGFPAYAVIHNPTFEASPGGSDDNLGSLTSYYHTDWRRSVYAGVEESDGTWGSKPAFSSEGSLGRISFF